MVAAAWAFVTVPIPHARGSAGDEQEIRALIARYGAAANARDVPAVVRCYAPTDAVLLFDIGGPPLRGVAGVTRTWTEFVGEMRTIKLEFRDIEVEVAPGGGLAFAHFIERASLVRKAGGPMLVNDSLRTTQIYRKIRGHWLIIHEHKSKSLSS